MDRSPSRWDNLGLGSIERYLESLWPRLTGDVGNSTWTPGCEHAVRQLLCHATLPFCKTQGEQWWMYMHVEMCITIPPATSPPPPPPPSLSPPLFPSLFLSFNSLSPSLPLSISPSLFLCPSLSYRNSYSSEGL